jgi:hypothetical protein
MVIVGNCQSGIGRESRESSELPPAEMPDRGLKFTVRINARCKTPKNDSHSTTPDKGCALYFLQNSARGPLGHWLCLRHPQPVANPGDVDVVEHVSFDERNRHSADGELANPSWPK